MEQFFFNTTKINNLRARTHFLYKNNSRKSLNNVKILHNTPLTFESICKIEALILQGADVTVLNCKGLNPLKEVEDIIVNSGIKYIKNHADISGNFDVYLDCAAQLKNLPNPSLGCAELTQIGSKKYKSMELKFPVISVNESKTKEIEALHGTGEAFIRAFKKFISPNLKDKIFVVFGFGKIGEGIISNLIKETKNIIVIDIDENKRKISDNYSLEFISGNDSKSILSILKKSYCVVSCTGVKNLFSNYYQFQPIDFENNILIDMGGNDEFGNNFKKEEVFGNKVPINFMLENPTLMEFIDPIFYAHNLCVNLLLDGNYTKPEFYPFPKEIDDKIVDEFNTIINSKIII